MQATGGKPLHATSVFVRRQFVTAPQLAARIENKRRLCDEGKFLDCCVEFYGIQEVCEAFSHMQKNETLATEDGFLEAYDESLEKKSSLP